MYSHADRIRAVELYIKLCKRVKATISQLGYPTKNALKRAALEHFRIHDRCISSTMRALGYPDRGTLTAWVREAFPETRALMAG